MGLSDGRKSFKIGLAIWIQYRRVTDGHPPTQPRRRSIYSAYYVARVKRCGSLYTTLLQCHAIGIRMTMYNAYLTCLIIIVITSAKTVMFLPLLVYLLVTDKPIKAKT